MKRGMSLLEVLVTLVLVALLFTPIFMIVQQSTKRVYRAGDETVAGIFATDIVELIRGGPYNALYTDGKTPDVGLSLVQVFGRSNFFRSYDPTKFRPDRFKITVDVEQAGDIDPSRLKQLRVTVSWKDKLDKMQAIKMVTFYSPANL